MMLPPYLPAFGLIFAVSLLLSLAATPAARRLGVRLGLVDRPGGRRRHTGPISRLGGAAMYLGFTAAVVLTLVLPSGLLPPRLDDKELIRLSGLLLGTFLVFVFGLLDDRFRFGTRPQYLAQFLSSLVAIAFIIFIERISNPLEHLGGLALPRQIIFPTVVVWALTIFWFMGMMNTVNWLDGLDGLAAGVAAIMSAGLAVHMIREGQYSVALLPVALLGATLGFLPFNFNPARIFMGSNGSYFLGWALAALGIVSGAKMATVLLVMGLPILDVAWLIFYRWRHGQRPSQDGRDHLHYRLVDMGYGQRRIVLGYYAFCGAFGVLALGIGNRAFKLVVLALLAAGAFGIMAWASRQPAKAPVPDSVSAVASPLDDAKAVQASNGIAAEDSTETLRRLREERSQ